MLPRQNRVIVKVSDAEEPKPMNLLYKKSGEEGKLEARTCFHHKREDLCGKEGGNASETRGDNSGYT